MREILFRGKREDNGEWVEGYLTRRPSPIQYEAHYSPWFIDRPPSDPDDSGDYYNVDGATVGQYTGLTVNGKRIFEGDIGTYKQTDGAKWNGKPIICTGKVVYNAKTASFAVDSVDKIGAKNYDYFPIKDFEIIGNIHDNPELLKGGAE